MSAKLVPTFVDRRVSRSQRNGFPRPYSRLSNRSRYFSSKQLLDCTHEAEWTPFYTYIYMYIYTYVYVYIYIYIYVYMYIAYHGCKGLAGGKVSSVAGCRHKHVHRTLRIIVVSQI
jgi:hypothetical protein